MISTLTKDGMISTLTDILKKYSERKDINNMKDVDISHTNLLLKICKDEIESEEGYMLDIENHINQSIKKNKEFGFFNGINYFIDRVKSYIPYNHIDSRSFIQHANSYDYKEIDFIGKLYIKVVLASLYAYSKDPNYNFVYSEIDRKFNITDKLHSSIQSSLDTPQSILKHSNLYYSQIKHKDFGKYSEDICRYDKLISEIKLRMHANLKIYNKLFTGIYRLFDETYPDFTFDISQSDNFQKYYIQNFELKSTWNYPILHFLGSLIVIYVFLLLSKSGLQSVIALLNQIKGYISKDSVSVFIEWVSTFKFNFTLTLKSLERYTIDFIIFYIRKIFNTILLNDLQPATIIQHIANLYFCLRVVKIPDFETLYWTKTEYVVPEENIVFKDLGSHNFKLKFSEYNELNELNNIFKKSKTVENYTKLISKYLDVQDILRYQINTLHLEYIDQITKTDNNNLIEYQNKRFQLLAKFVSNT